MKFRFLPVALAVCLTLGPLPGAAADREAPHADQKKAAQKMFEAGDALYESGRFDDAVEAFRQSHTLVDSPNSRLMLARSLRELGKTPEACSEFSGTIADAEASGGRYPEALQAATAELDALKAQTSGDCSKKPSEVAPPSAPPQAPIATSTPRAAVDTTSADSGSIPPLRLAAWVTAGIGTAGVLGFATFGYLNKKAYSDLEHDCRAGNCSENVSDRVDTGQRYQTLANVSLSIGLVGAAAATTLFIISSPHSAEGKRVSLSVGPSTVVVDGRF